MKRLIFWLAYAFTSLAIGSEFDNTLWLSDTSPKRESNVSAQNSLEAQIADAPNIHGEVRRLWFRQGSEPANALYVATKDGESVLEFVDIHGNRRQVDANTEGGVSRVQIELAELGFHNAYFSKRQVDDGILNVQLAKAEVLKGTCCMKASDFDQIHQKAIFDPTQPLEIVRAHMPEERLFTRLVSGDKLTFTVLRFGQPLPNVSVTLTTQQGWRKIATSNAQGQVEFTLIRDYFPDWKNFYRLNKSTFVVVASLEQKEAGKLNGETYNKTRYLATLSGRYALSPYDYKSYAWGLGVTLFVVIFSGLAVYLYRRRRLKPFREVRFSESP